MYDLVRYRLKTRGCLSEMLSGKGREGCPKSCAKIVSRKYPSLLERLQLASSK